MEGRMLLPGNGLKVVGIARIGIAGRRSPFLRDTNGLSGRKMGLFTESTAPIGGFLQWLPAVLGAVKLQSEPNDAC